MATFYTGGVLVVGGSSTFTLKSMTGIAVDAGTQEAINTAAGQPVPSYAGLMTSAPMISFSTTDIETALTNIQLEALYFPKTTIFTTVDAYLTKIANITARVASATAEHTKFAMGGAAGGVYAGMIVPKTLAWSQGGEATLSLEVHPIYPGTSATAGSVSPWVITTLSALPSTPLITEKFTGGKVIIDVVGASSVTMESVQSVSLDFGLTPVKLFTSGGPFPSQIHLSTIQPVVKIRTKDSMTNYTAFDDGVALDGTGCDIYLQEIVSGGGGRSAGATSMRVRIAKGMVFSSSVGGGNNEEFETEITVRPLMTADVTDTITFTANTTQP